MKERKMMGDMEKRMLQANIELVKEQNELRKDISILISYIKGNTQVEREVKTIIKRFTRMTPGEKL